nr:unnamed protein product [Callosobruchus chinensis]
MRFRTVRVYRHCYKVLPKIQPSHAVENPGKTWLGVLLTYLGAATPTTLTILDVVQNRSIGLMEDSTLSRHIQPLSHRCRWRAVSSPSLLDAPSGHIPRRLFFNYQESSGTNALCSQVQTRVNKLLIT